MGVTVLLNSPVSDVGVDQVVAGDFASGWNHTTGCGSEGNPVSRSMPKVALDPAGRILTDASLTIPNYPNVLLGFG